MDEIELDGKKYRIGKIDARKQFHVARRIAPILQGLGESFSKMPTSENGETSEQGMWSALAPVADALADMEDEKLDYVINICLAVVTRVTEQNTNAKVMAGGQLMFNDIKMTDLIQLTVAVLQENLSDFFSAPLLQNSDAGEKEARAL